MEINALKERKYAATILLIIIMMLLVVPMAADNYLLDRQKITFNAEVNVSEASNVSDQVGIAAGSDQLDFGDINTETNSTRFITLKAPEKTKFSLEAKGNISAYLNYRSDMYFKGVRNISVEIRPEEAGIYSGELIIKAEYAEGGLGKKWMQLKH